MQSDEVRRGYTGRAFCAFSPWNDTKYIYSVLQLHLGNNPIINLEVVSSLNSFNITNGMYHYNMYDRPKKYNLKIYLGAVQSLGYGWNSDLQTGQQNGLPNLVEGDQKSGSCCIKKVNPVAMRIDLSF